jgi:aspartate/methionine/tyrosine aminotransferase
VNNTSNSPLLNAGNATCGEREYINLSIGEPHLALSEDVIEAIAKSMRDGFTKYVSPQGILPLREKIVSKFCSGLNWPITAENVLVGSGVSNLINLLLMSYIEPNDSVYL